MPLLEVDDYEERMRYMKECGTACRRNEASGPTSSTTTSHPSCGPKTNLSKCTSLGHATSISNRRPIDHCFLFLATNRRIHESSNRSKNQKAKKQCQTNRTIPHRRHWLLQKWTYFATKIETKHAAHSG